jgi:hypothetical protein
VPVIAPSGGALIHQEKLTLVSANVIPHLAFAPDGSLMMLVVNGQVFTPQDGSFSVSGTGVSWISTIYSVGPQDMVIAIYGYAE